LRTIARDCLRYDPRQRCTIAEIRTRLETTPEIAVPPPPAESKPPRPRLLIPIAAILVLAGVFVGPKLLSRHEQSSVENTGKAESPGAAPAQPVAASPVTKPANSAPSRTASKGEVEHQVLPAVPQSARNTIHGKVKVDVRVQVDPSGKVTSAKLTSHGPSKYFANLALKSAQQWRFTPPQENDQPAPSAWLLRFQFGRGGTQVFPAQERR